MNEEAPESKEVAHFHFNQLRTLKITKGNEEVPRESLNVIAPASKYGLLFVGVSNGFKVLKLENILDLDEDKENKSLEENYYSQVVSSEAPTLLSLSADQKTLAVCVKRNANVFADMYDIAAFADPEERPMPFQNVLLSVSNSKLKDFIWNPVTDGMYAYCMSDGSLSVHELTGMKSTVIAMIPNAGATAACWSPKGKQIVIGRKDGSLGQYKPTLQEVKSIPAPNGEKYSVANICWVSTAQFAVLYVPEGQNVSPCLFIVSTPKNAPVVYMNFFDICLGNANSDDQRYFLHHESAWGVLVCASTDSIEVAVLGDSPSWVQWEVRDDCRALLPAKHGSRNAASMGVMYCSQRSIIISETEVYPPMPIIFYLTDNGLLVSYHLVNSAPGSVSLVRPSTPIDRENERKRPDGNQNLGGPAASNSLPYIPHTASSAVPAVVSPAPAFQTPPPVNASIPSIQSATSPAFGFGQNSSFQRNEPQQPPPFGAVPFQNVGPPPKAAPIGLYRTPPTPAAPLENERFHKTSKGMSVSTPTSVIKDTPVVRHVAVAQRSIAGSKPEFEKDAHIGDTDTNLKPSQPQAPHIGTGDSNLVHKENASNQYTYLAAIFDEVQTFDKEMQDLKMSSDLFTNIGSKEEMASLVSSSLKFQEFQNGMAETMVSLNSDIHSLKNVLLESFVMVEEANSKEKRKNDHSYISMLKDRALDPMTAKRMQTIDQHYMYLNTQLQEVSNKLDLDWFEFLEKKKENQKTTRHISSAEAIYKTVVNHEKIIQNLQNSVGNLSRKAADKKLENIYRRRNKSQFTKRSDSDELSKLADAFLQTKISNAEDEKPQLQRKMSSDAQNVLKKYLSSSTISAIRPTIIYSPSQSRFLSKSLLYAEQHDNNKTQASVPNNDQPVAVQPKLDKSSPNMKPSSVMKPVITNQPPMLISSTNLETFANENKTPISKPRVTSALEFEKLRLQNRVPTAVENTNVDQFKGTLNKSSKFIAPTLSFAPPKPAAPVPSPAEIESPIYEDITPPDSPDLSKYTQSMPETKTIQVSFNQGVPEVQCGSPPSVFEKKGLTSEKLDQFQSMQEAKQPSASRMFPPPSNPPEPIFTPFSILSPPDAKPSTGASSADVAAKNETNVSEKNKALENVFNPLSKPVLGKPAATSTFSMFTPTSNVSFPNFSTTPSFFSTPAKKEESSALKSPQPASNLIIGPKPVPDGSDKAPVTSTFFTSPIVGSNQGKPVANTLFSSQKSIFSGSEKKTFFPPLAVSTSPSTVPTSGSETFFSKPPTATKEFTFFQPSVVSTPASSQFSPLSLISSEPAKDALTEANSPEQPNSTAHVVPKADEPSKSEENQTTDFQTTSQPAAFYPQVARSAFNQAPINLSQKTETIVTSADKPTSTVSAVSTIQSTVTSTSNQAEPPSGTAVPEPQAAAIVKPAGLVLGQPSFSTTTTSASTTTTPSESQGSATSTSSNAPVAIAVGQSALPSTPSQPAVSSSQLSEPAGSSVGSPFFGGVPSTTSDVPAAFSQTGAQTTAFSQTQTTSSLFPGQVMGAATSVFGQTQGTTSSFFDQSATTKSSFFGKTTDTPAFGQASVFGSTAATTTASGSFPQAAGTFFSQSPGGQTSVFGGSPANTTGNSVFGSQPAAAKSPFGQTQGSFGLAKSVFGQQNNTTPSVFGQPASPPSNTAPFGQTSGNNIFGQGSFFSGLGGKPSAENASKNVFSVENLTAQPSEQTSVFGATAFGAKTGSSFTGGSFSSGGGSVAQSGFGAFRQQTPQKTGAFGAAPAFGSAPSFGSPPAFGSPPSFGGGCTLGAVFGSSQTAQTANFSNFASASSPTFGSLASQSPGGFGNSQQTQQPTFGQSSPFGAAPVFGSGPAFGGQQQQQQQQPSSFGSPSGPTGSSSAFTQWRN